MYQNLIEEKNIIKQAETRLMEENKSLINQQKGQNTLLSNLQSIQVSDCDRELMHKSSSLPRKFTRGRVFSTINFNLVKLN